MVESIVETLLLIVALYAGIGVLFAIFFHVSGLTRIDAAARGAGVFFRTLITPGVIALWPVLVRRWRSAVDGESGAGPVHRPLSATALRSWHRRLVLFLAVAVPVAAGAGIVLRPARPHSPTRVELLCPPQLGERLATHESPFDGLPITAHVRGDATGARQLELEVGTDLEIPTLLLYWAPGNGKGFPGSSVFLGGVWGPGTRRYPLTGDAASAPGTLVLYSLAHHERIASSYLPAVE